MGNHDVVALSRDQLFATVIPASVAAVCSPQKLYYDHCPHPGYRFIVLDAFDVCAMNASSPELQRDADLMLRTKNPNVGVPGADWFRGIPEADHRYVPFNGGLSDGQMAWLVTVLQDARDRDEIVVVFCHLPCLVTCSESACLLWNAEALLSCLQAAPHVVAYVSGHDHTGGYAVDDAGIHHLVRVYWGQAEEG